MSNAEADGASESEKDKDLTTAVVDLVPDEDVEQAQSSTGDNTALDNAVLQRVFIRATWFSCALALVVTILIPMPLFGTHYVFSRKFFSGWVGVSIAWLLLAGSFCV